MMFERIISTIRSIALIGAMAFIFMVVGLNADSTNNVASILFVSALVFIVLEICGIIYRCIRAGRAQTEEQQKFIMMFSLNNGGEISLTSTIRRISLLGIVAIIICTVLGHPAREILNSPFTGLSLTGLFIAYMKWSVFAYPIISIISILKFWYILPHLGEGVYSMGTIIIKFIWSDITCLFINAKNLTRHENKALPLIKLIFSIALIVFVVLGIISLVK